MSLDAILGTGFEKELKPIPCTEDGLFSVDQNSAESIWTPHDRKAAFVVLKGQILCRVHSLAGYPAYYPMYPPNFQPPAKAVLMDLDGTSVRSERFWMWIIARTVARLRGEKEFRLEPEDEPFVSGHSVTEHLRYCLDKYASQYTLAEARDTYFAVARYEMREILDGRGKQDAFTPSPHLKEFLLTLKQAKIKIGLVTSGLTEKAMPEIVAAFRTLDMGDPRDFYDAIISAGTPMNSGEVGTLGELEAKPHPWLYAEIGKIGFGLDREEGSVIAMEDSSAGVIAARLAGFPCIGIEGGNIRQSGVSCLCAGMYRDLLDTLPHILG